MRELIRHHQFDKVKMVQIVQPDKQMEALACLKPCGLIWVVLLRCPSSPFDIIEYLLNQESTKITFLSCHLSIC